jgi:hypothetical protein
VASTAPTRAPDVPSTSSGPTNRTATPRSHVLGTTRRSGTTDDGMDWLRLSVTGPSPEVCTGLAQGVYLSVPARAWLQVTRHTPCTSDHAMQCLCATLPPCKTSCGVIDSETLPGHATAASAAAAAAEARAAPKNKGTKKKTTYLASSPLPSPLDHRFGGAAVR